MLSMAFAESTMSRTQIQLWYNWLKEGREDVNDDALPGCPSTSTTDENIEAVKKMILDNLRFDSHHWLLMRLAYRLVHAKHFLRMF